MKDGGKRTVVLVRAEIPTRMKETFLPNNILALAEALLRHGWNPKLIDMRVQDFKSVLSGLDLSDVVCVGISTLTGSQISYGLEFARHIRAVLPQVPIVWGGPHPSLRPEETAHHSLVDVVVRGEGEPTLVELVAKMSSGADWRDVKGITWCDGGEAKSTADRDWVDLDAAGDLPYELLEMERYAIDEQFTYHSSRGCPHKCGFCINHAFQKSSFRAQSPETILRNVRHIIDTFGVTRVHFTDDNFFVNRKRVEQFCTAVVAAELGIEWGSACRFDYFARYSDEFLGLLRDSGCRKLGYGAESGSVKVLKYIEKEIKPEDVVKSVKKARQAGIVLSPVSFMYGFPGEDADDLEASIDLIDEIRKAGNGNTIVNGMFLLTAYPGTPIADELEQKGYPFPTSLEGWSKYLMSAGIETATWVDKHYLARATTASNLIRFRYFLEIGAERKLTSAWLRLAYRIFVAPFLVSERIRWPRRWFGLAWEWRFWAYVRTKFLKVT